MNKGTILTISIALALIGLVDASYLTVTHYTDTQVACPDSGIINCENVLNSPYSIIFGVPFAVLGLIFFLIEIFVIALRQRDLFIVYNGIGVAVVVQLLYIEYLVGNICLYCTLIHIIVVSLFVLAILNYNAPASNAVVKAKPRPIANENATPVQPKPAAPAGQPQQPSRSPIKKNY
jgi:uncharacterized membrane protein